MGTDEGVSPLMAGFLDHRVSAQITALDHYRVGGGVAVETDYIISVKCIDSGKKTRPEPDFDMFTISKTYSAFRTLADQLHDVAEKCLRDVKGDDSAKLPVIVQQVAKYCEMVDHLVDSQRTHYLGKVNYTFVRLLAKQRKQIINDVLETTLVNFPSDINSHPLLVEVAEALEAFFLTDHCEEVEEENESDIITNYITPKKNYAIVRTRTDVKTSTRSVAGKEAEKLVEEDATAAKSSEARTPAPTKGIKRTVTSPVVPHTRKTRRSNEAREKEEAELQAEGNDANLLLDDDRPATELVPSYAAPQPTVASSVGSSALGTFIDNNPIIFLIIFVAAIYVLRRAEKVVMTVDLDLALLLGFASFCFGLHCPRPLVGGVDVPSLQPRQRRGGRKPARMRTKTRGAGGTASELLRKSFLSVSPRSAGGEAAVEVVMEDMISGDEGAEQAFDWIVKSPMDKFPDGAELGSHFNCWSDTPASKCKVRGEKYLKDSKKIPSGEYLLPTRGIDLFLTDACPENVGRVAGVLGGELREKPTFIINFRLPWGVLLGYYEIPERFIPFVKARYEPSAVDPKAIQATLKKMSNPDRCCARFFMGDSSHKDSVLKIVPGVADGPWVVKSVVGGKPAIIGTKLPVNYFYEPEKEVDGEDGKKVKQALYLEADLDIVSSSAARGILSVCRQYTQDLTLDLGFVVQGNTTDELPEQMLLGTRLHGIDPMNAPPLPPMTDMLMGFEANPTDDESLSNIG